MLRNITAKKLKTGIKNGNTRQDFCQKFECTEEELFQRIEQLYTVKGTAQEVWKEIIANEKKARAKRTKEESIVEVGETNLEPINEQESEFELEIEELKANEQSLRDELFDLEVEHKKLTSKRRALREGFSALVEEIQKLQEEYNEKGAKAEEIAQMDMEIVSQMNSISDVYREKRRGLEALQTLIESRSKIDILVYEDGEITCLDDKVQLNDEGHEELFANLREREEAEDFRPKDLRVVAKVIRVVANLSAPFEISFDNLEVKEGYEIFS